MNRNTIQNKTKKQNKKTTGNLQHESMKEKKNRKKKTHTHIVFPFDMKQVCKNKKTKMKCLNDSR